MKEFFKDILTDNTTKFGFLTAFVITFSSAIFALFSYKNLPPFLPIFNQLPWGEKRLGTTIQIFIPIAIVFSLFLLNLILAPFFYKKNPLVSRVLAVVTLISSIFVFLFVTKIVQQVL